MPTLAKASACTGCSACANICPHGAISIGPDKSGFLMPSVDESKCVECKLCEKACPIVNDIELKHPEVKEVYAFWDNRTRTESSSGGAFSAIARRVLEQGGVVFGAAWQEGFNCRHISCNDVEGLSALRGSKYLQSEIGKTFAEAKKALIEGKYVLFTGTPCQIAGLRSFLRKPYEKLLTVDIVCHGTPSNELFKNYIDKLKREYPKYAQADGFEFRNLRGWGYAPSLKIRNKFSKELTGVPNLYMAAFKKSATARESCYDCQFNGLSRVGDITIADFWGVGAFGTPFKHDVSKGVSLVLLNSEKGREVFSELKDCFVEKRDVKEAVRLNHNLVGSSRRPADREEVIEAFNNPHLSLNEIDSRFHLTEHGLKRKIMDMLISTGLFWKVKSIVNKIRSI